MRSGVVVGMGCALLLCGVASAPAAQDLDANALRVEIARNRTMAAYVARNGAPDVAERQFLAARPPWDKYEVVLYYLGQRREIAFARAWIIGRPEIHLVRYERALTDAEVAELSSRAQPRTPVDVTAPRTAGGMAAMNPAERAERAAAQAEQAAARVEMAADTAERAVARTEAIVAKMETSRRVYRR